MERARERYGERERCGDKNCDVRRQSRDRAIVTVTMETDE